MATRSLKFSSEEESLPVVKKQLTNLPGVDQVIRRRLALRLHTAVVPPESFSKVCGPTHTVADQRVGLQYSWATQTRILDEGERATLEHLLRTLRGASYGLHFYEQDISYSRARSRFMLDT